MTTKLGSEIWRDYETDGVPASGAHKIIKSDMRDWMLSLEVLGLSKQSDAQIKVTRTSGSTYEDLFKVLGSISGDSLFCRAFYDGTVFSSTAIVTNGAYCSYAAYSTMTSGADSNHYYGYESAITQSGTGAVNVMASYYSGPSISGPVNLLRHFWVNRPSLSGGPTILHQYGYYCDDLVPSNGDVFGFYCDVSYTSNTGTGGSKWSFYAHGDAPAYLQGGLIAIGQISTYGGLNSEFLAMGTDTQRVKLTASATGVLNLMNGASNNFTMVTLGPVASTWPALKRDGPGIRARLSDDSADTWLKVLRTAVSGLPSASTSGSGAFAIVTDANSPTIGATVAGGGSTQVFVISDGTNWKVG